MITVGRHDRIVRLRRRSDRVRGPIGFVSGVWWVMHTQDAAHALHQRLMTGSHHSRRFERPLMAFTSAFRAVALLYDCSRRDQPDSLPKADSITHIAHVVHEPKTQRLHVIQDRFQRLRIVERWDRVHDIDPERALNM